MRMQQSRHVMEVCVISRADDGELVDGDEPGHEQGLLTRRASQPSQQMRCGTAGDWAGRSVDLLLQFKHPAIPAGHEPAVLAGMAGL